MLLTADTATNFNNMHLCIPVQIKKSTNTANNIDDDLMTVNNVFAHFIREMDIRSEIKYDVDNAKDASWLYTRIVAFVCNWRTIAPLTDYANNPTCQDLTKANKYFSSDEKMHFDLGRSKGHTDELESLVRDDSKLTLTVTLKDAAT